MPTRRRALLASPLALLLTGAAEAAAPAPWPEVTQVLAHPLWAGSARLRVMGLAIYDAQLWVAPGFVAQRYAQHAFALSLSYLRQLRGSAIAARSITEMLRQGPIDPATQAVWQNRMQALFPDVARGDRLTGVHQPGLGARFWLNGRFLGEVEEPGFGPRFFGIWLHSATSEPDMRRQLLAELGVP